MCFVISEFGSDEKTRIERKQMLKHLVRKVCEPMGYTVQRADDIDDLGQITHQIIERLLDDDLVVADLTGLNPNVFYELAVRHAARKPVITLMTHGQPIPFDVKDVRTVFYDLHDPDRLEAAQDDLRQKVEGIEQSPVDVRNPITVARNVTLLQQSDDPKVQAAGAVLEAIADLRDEMRKMSINAAPSAAATEMATTRLLGAIRNRAVPPEFTARDLASDLSISPAAMQESLDRMVYIGNIIKTANDTYRLRNVEP